MLDLTVKNDLKYDRADQNISELNWLVKTKIFMTSLPNYGSSEYHHNYLC